VDQESVVSKKTREEQIAYRAYMIWLADGKPEGRDKEHWQEAEFIVDQIPRVDGEREVETST
jgi:uncharacterized protein YegL